jgi:hypothetical protein
LGQPVPVKIQTSEESLESAIDKLLRACKGKHFAMMLVVQTNTLRQADIVEYPPEIKILQAPAIQLKELLENSHLTSTST